MIFDMRKVQIFFFLHITTIFLAFERKFTIFFVKMLELIREKEASFKIVHGDPILCTKEFTSFVWKVSPHNNKTYFGSLQSHLFFSSLDSFKNPIMALIQAYIAHFLYYNSLETGTNLTLKYKTLSEKKCAKKKL